MCGVAVWLVLLGVLAFNVWLGVVALPRAVDQSSRLATTPYVVNATRPNVALPRRAPSPKASPRTGKSP